MSAAADHSERIRLVPVAPRPHPGGRLADAGDDLLADLDFDVLYPDWEPPIAPLQLALVTVMQHLEGLADAQAATAVRVRNDWRIALGLLRPVHVDHVLLLEFRERVGSSRRGLTTFQELIDRLTTVGLLPEGAGDATTMLAAVETANRLHLVSRTLGLALAAVERDHPKVAHAVPMPWRQRAGLDLRVPAALDRRVAVLEDLGAAGRALLASADSSGARSLPEVELLRHVLRWLFAPGREKREAPVAPATDRFLTSART